MATRQTRPNSTFPASPPCDISNELAVMPVPGGTRLDVVLRLFGSGIAQESVWLPYPSSMCEEIIDCIHHGAAPMTSWTEGLHRDPSARGQANCRCQPTCRV